MKILNKFNNIGEKTLDAFDFFLDLIAPANRIAFMFWANLLNCFGLFKKDIPSVNHPQNKFDILLAILLSIIVIPFVVITSFFSYLINFVSENIMNKAPKDRGYLNISFDLLIGTLTIISFLPVCLFKLCLPSLGSLLEKKHATFDYQPVFVDEPIDVDDIKVCDTIINDEENQALNEVSEENIWLELPTIHQ